MSNNSLCSRYRNDVVTLFDVYVEIKLLDDKSTLMLKKYPEDYVDESILKSVKEFAFPIRNDIYDVEAVQLFCFVLTDSKSEYTFGYCRFSPRNKTCLCILSGLKLPEFFYKLLNALSVLNISLEEPEQTNLLNLVYHTDIPSPGQSVDFKYGSGGNNVSCSIPENSMTLCLKEDKFMLEFVNALTTKQMIALYGSLLKERRIVFSGKKLGMISSCVCATSVLLHPMNWQGIFIPVLPEHLADMLMAPMPFLIGVPKQVLQKMKVEELGEIVVIDLDERSFQSPFDDTAILPNDLVLLLKNSLSKTNNMGNSHIKAFLRVNEILFNGYKTGFTKDEQENKITWDRQKWINNQKVSHRIFLNSITGADGVQYFERFICVRLEEMNSGRTLSDGFQGLPEKSETDILSSIRGKVSGIQIASKFNKLKSSDQLKKVRGWSGQNYIRKSLDAQSFENLPLPNPVIPRRPDSVELKRKTDYNFVPVAKLIDFDDKSPDNLQASQARSLSHTHLFAQNERNNDCTNFSSAQNLFNTSGSKPSTSGNSNYSPSVSHPKIYRTPPPGWVKFD